MDRELRRGPAAPRSVMRQIWHRIQEDPDRQTMVFLDGSRPERTCSRLELWRAAGRAAAFLESAGLRPGDVCALLLPHRFDFGAWYWGAARLGALPAVLACPGPRQHPDKFRSGLQGMARHSGLDVLVTVSALRPRIEPLLEQGTVRRILSVDEAAAESGAAGGWPDERYSDRAGSEAFLLQHSSGTTGLQKAVVLSHEAILAQLEDLAESLALAPETDRIVNWLPLYHDMGLIAAWLLPFVTGTPHVQLSPFDWVARPSLFLEVLSRWRGTLSWLPNFAYSLMAARVRDEELSGLDLRAVRALINCSEPVRALSHQRFLERLAPCGLRAEALQASYALAENVFAVTQTNLGRAPTSLNVAWEPLRGQGEVRLAGPGAGSAGRPCVSCGPLLRRSQARVLDHDGVALVAGRVGEIAIRSPYLFEGYRREGRTLPAAGPDGWFRTGDLGFFWEGELYVTGRKKDLLIVRGKNIYPEDIEDCVSGVEGVLPGRVAAYGELDEEQGTESVALLAETALTGEAERRVLAGRIREAVLGSLELQARQVHLVPPRWLVKSSSGKIARQENARRHVAEFGHGEQGGLEMARLPVRIGIRESGPGGGGNWRVGRLPEV